MKYLYAFLVSIAITIIGSMAGIYWDIEIRFLTGWCACWGYFATIGLIGEKEKEA